MFWKNNELVLQRGERVVHPSQGSCVVVGVEPVDLDGKQIEVLRLSREHDGAAVCIPIGLLRDVQLTPAGEGIVAPAFVRDRRTPRPGPRVHPDAIYLLLARFEYGTDVAQTDQAYWPTLLGTSTEEAIASLLKSKLVEAAPIEVALRATNNVSELKDLARKRGLKVSGTKDILAERLTTADRAGVQQLVATRRVIICTPAGAQLTRDNRAKWDADRTSTQERVAALLKAEMLEEACAALAEFDARQVAPWVGRVLSPCVEDDLERVRAVFSPGPQQGLLARMGVDEFKTIRVAAGMWVLWGGAAPGAWLPRDFEFSDKTAAEVALGELLDHVNALLDAEGRDDPE